MHLQLPLAPYSKLLTQAQPCRSIRKSSTESENFHFNNSVCPIARKTKYKTHFSKAGFELHDARWKGKRNLTFIFTIFSKRLTVAEARRRRRRPDSLSRRTTQMASWNSKKIGWGLSLRVRDNFFFFFGCDFEVR